MMKKSIVSLVLSLTLCLCLSVSASAYEMSKPGQVPTISSGQCGHTGIVDSNGTLWMCGRNFHGEVLDSVYWKLLEVNLIPIYFL